MNPLPTFQFSHTDHWGRRYVLCPVCEFPYEENVVNRHITKQAKGDNCAVDPAHRAWLKVHGTLIPNR